MKTAINYKAISRLPADQRVKQLAGAIDFELKKPSLCLEMAQSAVIASGAADVKSMRAANDSSLTHERIKSFLSMKYGTPSDTPELVDVANQMEQFFHTNMPEMDMAYAMLFDLIDLRGSTHDHFDILDTNAGITFNQKEPGETIKIRKAISESKTTVNYLSFADGLGLLDDWLKFNQFWKIDDAIGEFRAMHFEKMAATHYGLFTALSGVDQAFATDDVTTANNAMGAILRAVRTKGYGVSQNSTFHALCAPEHVGRIEKMLTAQRGSAIVDQGTVSQPLTVRIGSVIASTHIPAASTGYYLVLPGKKIKRGVWKDLEVERARNIYTKAEDITAESQYNAAIGDSDQVKKCLFA